MMSAAVLPRLPRPPERNARWAAVRGVGVASRHNNSHHRFPCLRIGLFSRGKRKGWIVWGNQADDDYKPTWDTYAHNSATVAAA